MIKMLLDPLINETSSLLQLFPFILALFVPIFLFHLYKWSSFSFTTKNSPPSPPKLPLVGNLHQLDPYLHSSLRALSYRYGPVMLLHFGSVPVLVVSSAEAAREIMKTHDLTFSNRPKSTVFKKLLYNNQDIASAPYGEYQRHMKSIFVLNLLSNKRVLSFRAVREEEVKSMMNKITESSSSSSSVLNLSEMLATLTVDVASRITLGKKYGTSPVGEGGKMFKELLREFMESIGLFRVGDYIPWLAWLSHVNGFDAKLDKVAREFDDFLNRVIQERVDHSSKTSCGTTDGHENEEEKKDFAEILLGIQENNLAGFPMDRVTIKALILDMFVGGTHTTNTVLEWAMAELLRCPRVMKKLQNEVRGIVENKSDITEDDLIRMNYLKAVIKETLRLHPPTSLLFRICTQSVKINGYDIKPNTYVIMNAWQIGRDSKLYNKGEEFEPERFLINSMNRPDYNGNYDFQFLPFGAGRRGCPGTEFAMATTEIALANLVHKFDWSLPDGARGEDIDMTEANGVITHRKYPLKVVAFPYLASQQNQDR